MANVTQKLQFALMKKASFNNFNGDRIVDDLINNEELWIAAIMDRSDLIKLRDLEDDMWNVDTLYILFPDDQKINLYSIVNEWNYDSIEILEKKDAARHLGTSHPQGKIMKIWWD